MVRHTPIPAHPASPGPRLYVSEALKLLYQTSSQENTVEGAICSSVSNKIPAFHRIYRGVRLASSLMEDASSVPYRAPEASLGLRTIGQLGLVVCRLVTSINAPNCVEPNYSWIRVRPHSGVCSVLTCEETSIQGKTS